MGVAAGGPTLELVDAPSRTGPGERDRAVAVPHTATTIASRQPSDRATGTTAVLPLRVSDGGVVVQRASAVAVTIGSAASPVRSDGGRGEGGYSVAGSPAAARSPLDVGATSTVQPDLASAGTAPGGAAGGAGAGGGDGGGDGMSPAPSVSGANALSIVISPAASAGE